MASVRLQTEAIATGRGPKYVLSGLLVCDLCGAKLVIVDRYCYGCSTNHYGGPAACANDARLRRAMLERELLAGIERDLLSGRLLSPADATRERPASGVDRRW